MGLFSRRARPALTMTWQPDCDDGVRWFTQEDEPIVAAAEEMDDDGCLSDAYGAQFYLAPRAASCLTIWAYAAPCGPDLLDGYFVGFCIGYQVNQGDSTWEAKLYHGDEYPEWYGYAAEAADAAWKTAIELLNHQAGATTVHASAEVIAGWFDWDGEPF
jgi:hypothetical protein